MRCPFTWHDCLIVGIIVITVLHDIYEQIILTNQQLCDVLCKEVSRLGEGGIFQLF